MDAPPSRRILLLGATDEASLGKHGLEGQAVRGDVARFPERSLDAVMAVGWEGLDLALVQRVLRPGGRLVLTGEPRPSSAREALRHYFDLEAPTGAGIVARTRRRDDVAGHFDTLGPSYAAQIPDHLRAHYLQRKLAAFDRLLAPGWRGGLGLELGCGVGWYANAIAQGQGRLVALDVSRVPLSIARGESRSGKAPSFVAGDTLRLPFADRTFDYAYAINMLHHLKRGEQERALDEVRRVLKRDAPFLLFEINTHNPLFAWYMRHVFPRTRTIDRGDEEFIHPARLPLVPAFVVERIEYSTFAPDFVPRWALPAARAAERLLERAFPRHAIHYVALLRPR